jgi:hypothetical protein
VQTRRTPPLRSISFLVAALLTGCGGSASPTPAALAPAGNVARARQKATATFTIRVPRHDRRRPRYVSPSTKSIGITVDPGTANQIVDNANLATGVTTVTIALTTGAHTFDIKTYDGALVGGSPSGNELSFNDGLAFTVKGGQNNAIGAVLGGIPAGIVVTPASGQDIQGNASTGFTLVGAKKADGATTFVRSFTVVSTDADGNFIVGPGSPTMSVTSGNTAAISSGVVSAANPTKFTFTPGNIVAVPAVATMTALATAQFSTGPTGGVSTKFLMRISNFNAPRIYGAGADFGSGKLEVWDENGNTITLPGTPFSAAADISALCYDPHNDSIYAADGSHIYRFSTAGSAVSSHSAAAIPVSLAYDGGTGYVYSAEFNSAVETFSESMAPVTVSGNWHESNTSAAPVYPSAMVPDTNNGLLYLLDAGPTSVLQGFTPLGAATTTWWVPANSGTLKLTGMAQDPATHDLYVLASNNTVQVFDESGNAVAVSGNFPGLTQAATAGWDATNARLYVYDIADAKMSAFDAEGDAIPLSGSFANISTLDQFVVVP